MTTIEALKVIYTATELFRLNTPNLTGDARTEADEKFINDLAEVKLKVNTETGDTP